MTDNKEYFKDRKITVVGLARSGVSAANLLQELGARVTASDIKSEDELRQYLGDIHPGVRLEAGGHRRESFLQAQTIVLSPGVPWDQPLLAGARDLEIEVISEIELAARLTELPIIAVTGTNGKSTTTVLMGEMLKASGRRASVGGNLGRPMVEMLREKDADFLVVEVSSFQLEGIVNFHPRLSLMLNISPDHLERHGSMESYLEAKKRIYLNMGPEDYLVVNIDQEELAGFGAGCNAARMTFSRRQRVQQGAFLEGGQLIVRFEGRERKIIGADEIRIKGTHNIENSLAAAAAAAACGVEPEAMREALRNFEGLPHRMERARELDGVLYVNDSKGTNVDAAAKSLESFEAPVILIAGGRDKGGGYRQLREAAEGKAKAVILLGEAKRKISAALGGAVETISAANMEEAVIIAHSMAEPGDVVLLSPACSSFDMFRDYRDRGEAFKKAVNELPAGKVRA